MEEMNGFTYEELSAIISYDPRTGVLTSKVDRGSRVKKGQVLGSNTGQGYLQVGYGGTYLLAHRVAYFLHFKIAPPEIDHKDLNRSNNRIGNLRPATHSENSSNVPMRQHNACGFKGVHKQNKTGRWRAQLKVGYKQHHLGYFDTPEEAHQAYVAASKRLQGEFARAG